MATVLAQAIGFILDNYADVIEGGNTHRGSGTSYRGIPGNYPSDAGLRDGTDTPLTASVHATATTAFSVSTSHGDYARWVKTDTPAYWIRCLTATNAQNVGQARKISNYLDATTYFVFVFAALSASTAENDTFAIQQGFKRLPDTIDIESNETSINDGFDRFFQLSMAPGERMEFFGNGVETYRGEMVLRLRILKRGHEQEAIASALENISILRAGMCNGFNVEHRDGTYTRALICKAPARIVKNDSIKIVSEQSFELIYRINTEVL